MRFDYRNWKIVEGSPDAQAVAVRFRRASLMYKESRYSIEKATAFILRDYPLDEDRVRMYLNVLDYRAL